MNASKFRRLSFIFALPEARETVKRQSMLDYARGFIRDIDLLQKSEFEIRKTLLRVYSSTRDFYLWAESRPDFLLGCIVEKESAILLANEVLNKVCKRLNETDWKEKSEIDLFCMGDFTVDKKYDLLSPFIRRDTWENLFKKEERYKTRRLEIWQPPNGDKLRWAVTLASRKKSNMLELVLVDQVKDVFPLDALSKTASEIQNKKKTFLTRLIGEE
jgi:hypothetical protein